MEKTLQLAINNLYSRDENLMDEIVTLNRKIKKLDRRLTCTRLMIFAGIGYAGYLWYEKNKKTEEVEDM